MLHWDRIKKAYIDPETGEKIEIPRINWVIVAVQIVGGIARLEYESGYTREEIIKWMLQGYVDSRRQARMLSRTARLPQYLFPVGCDSNDV